MGFIQSSRQRSVGGRSRHTGFLDRARRGRRRAGGLGFALLCAFVAAALPTRAALIDTPSRGLVLDAADVVVAGSVGGLGPGAAAGGLAIDGVPVAFNFDPMLGGGTLDYSALVALDASILFNPIFVSFSEPGGVSIQDRVVVLVGPAVADGEASLDSALLHLEQRGIDELVPALLGMVNLDFAALLPPGTRVLSKCIVDSFFGCLGRAKVDIDTPAPSFTELTLDLDAMPDAVRLDGVISGIRLELDINGSGLVPDCGLRVTIDQVSLQIDYALGVEPTLGGFDAVEVAGPSVSLSGFDQKFTSGVCDAPIIGDVIGLIVGEIDKDVRNALVGFFDDPDGSGPQDAALIDLAEAELDSAAISQSIGAALDIELRNPLVDIVEDDFGITIVSDTVAFVPPGSVACSGLIDLVASYDPLATPPVFGAMTPGGLPYDAAIALTPSAINQLLKALTECGFLQAELTSFEIFGNMVGITAAIMANFVPGLAALPPDTPLSLIVTPTAAPVVTAAAGPGGELFELAFAGLRVAIVEPADPMGTQLLEIAVDGRVGLDVLVVAGEIVAVVGQATADDLSVVIIEDQFGTDPAMLQTLAGLFLGNQLPTLVGNLGPFALPSFFGIDLLGVEVARNGDALAVYLDAVPVPEPGAGALGSAALLTLGFVARARSRRPKAARNREDGRSH